MAGLKQGEFTRAFSGFGASADDNAIVTFYKDAVPDEAATNAAGRPIFRDVEMVEIRFPGNLLTAWAGKATDEHRARYGRQYDAYLRGEEAAHEGTPIEQLTVLSRAQVKELKFLDIYTVEAAANLDDQAVQRIGMGGNRLRELARRYLDQANGLAPLAKLVAEKDDLEQKVAQQSLQLAEMNSLLVGLQHQLTQLAAAPRLPEAVPVALAAPQPAASSLDALDGDTKKPAPKRAAKAA